MPPSASVPKIASSGLVYGVFSARSCALCATFSVCCLLWYTFTCVPSGLVTTVEPSGRTVSGGWMSENSFSVMNFSRANGFTILAEGPAPPSKAPLLSTNLSARSTGLPFSFTQFLYFSGTWLSGTFL